MYKPDYELSENQRQFVEDAEAHDLEVHDYSGRFMYGKQCPSVHVDGLADFHTKTHYASDSLGLGFVIYAPH